MLRTLLIFMGIVTILSCNNSNRAATETDTTDHAMHKGAATASHNYCDSVNNGQIAKDTLKGSPPRTVMNTINGTHVHIEYSSPGVKDRIIWGGLVAYDKVWVTGAHGATTVQFSRDVEIAGKKVAAGTYAFFTIPGKESWIAIINRRFDQHLADEYNESEDVVRVNVQPEESALTQRLTYSVIKTGDVTGAITIQWEKIKINVPFKTIN